MTDYDSNPHFANPGSVGAYCEAPESDDLEHVVDDVTDEALGRLTS